MKSMDDILTNALTPSEEPEFRLNQSIIAQAKEDHSMKPNKIKKFTAIACSAALVLAAGSVSIYAARKLLLPKAVEKHFADPGLFDAFSGEDAVLINETQSYGGYDVTLLGVVSGKNLSKSLVSSSDGIHKDRTYAVVSIRHSDLTPMLSSSTEESFLVSPLIQGYDPNHYNIFTMTGASSFWVEDGVQYRIAECDNIEMFADHAIYLCVSEGSFYNQDAYTFDEATGTIARNESYDGLNALFSLPLDPSKADPKAAEQMIRSILEDDHTEEKTGDSEHFEDPVLSEFFDRLTPENIDEYASPLEETKQVLTPDHKGMVSYSFDVEGRSGGSSSSHVSWLFPDGKPGMSPSFGFGYEESEGLDSVTIETYTLNEDGTVTAQIYIPK